MSDKQSQIKARQTRITAEQAEIALLEALPDGLDIELAYQSSSEWRVGLKGDLLTAVHLLPPIAIEIRSDSWGHPEERKLDRLAQDGDISFPVWFSNDQKASWSTMLPNGMRVEVLLKDSSVDLMQPPKGYEIFRGPHKTFYKRIPLLVDSTPRTHSPVELFMLNWDEFYDRKNYNAAQKQFANMVKARSASNAKLTEADLPPMPPSTMSVAGEELVIMGSPRVLAPQAYTGQLSALVRAGGFWKAFTPEMAKELLDFSNEMATELQEEEDQFSKKTAVVAKNLADEFIATFVKTQRNSPNARVIAAWVSARLGVTVSITQREKTNTGLTKDVLLHRHWVTVGRIHEGWEVKLPASYDPAGFDWEYPAFVEYEAAGPLFEKPLAMA